MEASNGIEVEGLVREYKKGPRAVDGIDISVAPGEIYGFLGPNGAGKSTTVHVLTTLLPPTAGTARVGGFDVVKDGPKVRSLIGVALQEAALDPLLTGRDHLRLQATLQGVRKDQRQSRAEELLHRVGLADAADRKVSGYSGGMKRRLDLALALIHSPRILFLDEPTTGLDPQARRQVWDVIADVKARGGTVLLTTHYMEEAERLCDRIAIVDRGKVIALDTPAALIAGLGAEHVLEIETESDVDLPRLRGLREVHDLRRDGATLSLTVREVHRAIPQLLAELDAQSVALTRLTTHHATLEDVFVSMTGRHLRDN
jgi:ABC-2 type transport system ATP-binding protein